MPPRPDPSSPRMNLRLSNRRIFISDFKSLHISAHLSFPRMNSRVPLPRRPRFRPLLVPIRASHCRDDCPERAQPLLPRMNLAIRAARPCPGQITKKGDEINRPTPHYQAQLRAAKNRRRIFLNEFPKAGRDQPAVRRPPIERLPYARLVFRRFRVTTACAPKLKKRGFFTENDLTNYSIQLNKKVKEMKK